MRARPFLQHCPRDGIVHPPGGRRCGKAAARGPRWTRPIRGIWGTVKSMQTLAVACRLVRHQKARREGHEVATTSILPRR